MSNEVTTAVLTGPTPNACTNCEYRIPKGNVRQFVGYAYSTGNFLKLHIAYSLHRFVMPTITELNAYDLVVNCGIQILKIWATITNFPILTVGFYSQF